MSGGVDWVQVAKRGMLISAAEAARLADGLRTLPGDLAARVTLIGYCRGQMTLAGHLAASEHVITLIRSRPDLSLPVFGIIDPYRCPAPYAVGRSAWLAAVAAYPHDAAIALNAAAYLRIADGPVALAILEAAPPSEPVTAMIEKLRPRQAP